MRQHLRETISEIIEKTTTLLQGIDIGEKKKQLANKEQQTFDPDFWNKENAQSIMEDIGEKRSEIENIETTQQHVDDLTALVELYDETEEESLLQDIQQKIKHVKKTTRELELQQYLHKKYDKKNALLTIFAGQGGTEAMDWTSILSRMYARFFERRGWKYEVIDQSYGEEAGLKSITYLIKGSYAYGYLQYEQGTHRLVRLSPFNANNLRQTSFAGVEVVPFIEETDEDDIEIKSDEVEWNFTRAGGHGGQNVNKVSSAVELTHIPTGIRVDCRMERTQEANRKIAMQMLTSKLAQKEEEKREKELTKEKGGHTKAAWGTQIRNYVLHPYKLVKDTRTEVETSDTDAVLDGDLDEFIAAEVVALS